jgi:hypothetical protein
MTGCNSKNCSFFKIYNNWVRDMSIYERHECPEPCGHCRRSYPDRFVKIIEELAKEEE